MTSTNNSMIEQNSATQNYRKTPEIVLLSTILFIITLIAFFGNAIVIATICCFQKWRDEISNLLIVNLAITDLFTSVAVMVPTMVSFTANKWTMGDIMCNITCACNYCLIIVSMLTLSFISIVRYHGVINSLQYPVLITRVRVTMMIGYSWFQGITFSMVPVILGWIKYDYWEATCAIQWYHQRHNAVYYVIIAFIFCFLLPTTVIFGCYGFIIREVKKSSTRILSITVPNRQEGTQSTQISNETSKFISSFIVVFIAFFICMTPFCVTKLIKIVKKESTAVPPYVNLIATWIGYASSAINPLLYSLFRKDFREAFKKLISIATNSNR